MLKIYKLSHLINNFLIINQRNKAIMNMQQDCYCPTRNQHNDKCHIFEGKKKLHVRKGRVKNIREENCQLGAWKSEEKCQSSNIFNILQSNLYIYENCYKLSQNQKKIGLIVPYKNSSDLGQYRTKDKIVDKQNEMKLPQLKQKYAHRKGKSLLSSQTLLLNKMSVQQKSKMIKNNTIMIDAYRDLKSKYSNLSGSDSLDTFFLKKQKYMNISKTLKLNLVKQQRTQSKLKDHNKNQNNKHLLIDSTIQIFPTSVFCRN